MTFSVFKEIFYPPNFDYFEENRLFHFFNTHKHFASATLTKIMDSV